MRIIPISADLVSGSQFAETLIELCLWIFWVVGDCWVSRVSGDGLMDHFSSSCSSLVTHHQWSYLAAIFFRVLKHRNFLPYQGTVLGLLVTVIFLIDAICKDPKSCKNIQSVFYTFWFYFFLRLPLFPPCMSGLKQYMGWVICFYPQIRCITEVKIIREKVKEHFKTFSNRLLCVLGLDFEQWLFVICSLFNCNF